MRAKLFLTTALSALIALMPLQTAAAQELPRDPGQQVSVQDRARPDYDPLGIRLGGFDLNASIGVGVTSTDNVLAQQDDAQSDVITYVRPQATLASHWSRHALRIRAGGFANSHGDFDQDNVTNYYAGVDGRLDIMTRSEIGGGASFNREHQERADPDAPLGIAEPVEYDRSNAYLYARHSFNRLRLTGRVEQATYDYKDTPSNTPGVFIEQDDRDHDVTIESLRAEYALTPRLGALVEVAANQREYDLASVPPRDSDGTVYGVGVAFEFTDLVRGEALITQFEQDYDNPSVGTVDGTGFRGRVEWFPTQLTTVNFNAGRDVEDSAFVGASYVRTEAGVRVDHELRRNIILSAGARMENREYDGINRDDDLVGADLGASYVANRRMRFNVGYSHRQNDSNVDGGDYEENRLTAGVSFHL